MDKNVTEKMCHNSTMKFLGQTNKESRYEVSSYFTHKSTQDLLNTWDYLVMF